MYDIWELRKKYWQHIDIARMRMSESMYEATPSGICLRIDQAIASLELIKKIMRGSMPETPPGSYKDHP